ncbi:hypothetical protein HOC01_03010 [archaeon]|jgi:sugar-specific transcriptional regulator TrmB|nr:hypothetical protein [archaeon]MBT6698140.1 hypothetical protein [archaeon]
MVSDNLILEYGGLLEGLGFTGSEVKVYFALLGLGQSTTGSIVKKSGVGSGKVYQVLDKLILKGLVSYVVRNKVKEFAAQDPKNLLRFVQSEMARLSLKEKKLKEIMPILEEEFTQTREEVHAEVFEGIKGFKTCYEFILSEVSKGSEGVKHEEVLVLGAPQEALDKFKGYLYDWNERREEAKVPIKILYNGGMKQKAKNSFSRAKVKYLEKGDESPAWILVSGDYVVTMHVHGSPICFLLKDKTSAKSYRAQFAALWKTAK